MNPLAIAIAKGTGKQLAELGKSGLKRLLEEPLVQTAATNTQKQYEETEVREALITWSKSDGFLEVLTDLKEGATQDLSASVPQFIESTGFYLLYVPPFRPFHGVINLVPDALNRSFNAPDSDEFGGFSCV